MKQNDNNNKKLFRYLENGPNLEIARQTQALGYIHGFTINEKLDITESCLIFLNLHGN